MPETRTSANENSSASSPLLTRQSGHYSLFGGRVRSSTAISILLGLILGRHGASMTVRESAAHQLEVSRDNWGYSFPVVVINTIWNLAFVVVSVVMLLLTAREKPDVPIRAWICVYALQRVVHVVLVWFEYRRRRNLRAATADSSSSSDMDSIFGHSRSSDETSTPKILEYYNTIIQYLWLLVAFLLLSNLDMQSAPRLYWLTVTFLAMDVFFAVIGCLRSLLITFAICCCLQSVIAFLFFMSGISGQRGASEEEIKILPMYKYQVSNDEQQPEVGGKMVPSETNDPEYSSEQAIRLEDADCCICLSPYEEGTELHLLPCNHQFHATCIVKWLRGSRFCPLCKHVIPQSIKV